MNLRNVIATSSDWNIPTPESKPRSKFGLGADTSCSDSFAPTNLTSSSTNFLNEVSSITNKHIKSADIFGKSYQSNQNAINDTYDKRVR